MTVEKINPKDAYGQRVMDQLASVDFVVEATDFEMHTVLENSRLFWKHEHGGGIGPIIAKLDGRNISISIMFVLLGLEEKRVVFWHPITGLVDYGLIDEWFLDYCEPPKYDNGQRRSHVRANDFHSCLRALGFV